MHTCSEGKNFSQFVILSLEPVNKQNPVNITAYISNIHAYISLLFSMDQAAAFYAVEPHSIS